jgi:hypothetical protein
MAISARNNFGVALVVIMLRIIAERGPDGQGVSIPGRRLQMERRMWQRPTP